MKIPFLPIHIMTTKTLKLKLCKAEFHGKEEACQKLEPRMRELLDANILLARHNLELAKFAKPNCLKKQG